MFSKGTRRAFIAALALGASTISNFAAAAAAPELLDDTHANVRAVKALQDKVTRDLMKLENVLGTAIGLDDNGQASLVVYVEKGGAKTDQHVQTIPGVMNGVPVKVELTEKFRALGRPPGKGKNGGGTVSGPGTPHTGAQTLPIELGTSGGWRNDSANG